mmetsp:Transcript_50392/g.109817  ORF Transcript_50392/g.109817 Transcript_50392/m.109817 type:complete len:221 (+) Transcript_50392:853-1515(+)
MNAEVPLLRLPLHSGSACHPGIASAPPVETCALELLWPPNPLAQLGGGAPCTHHPCPRCSYATLALPSGFAGADPGTERCPVAWSSVDLSPPGSEIPRRQIPCVFASPFPLVGFSPLPQWLASPSPALQLSLLPLSVSAPPLQPVDLLPPFDYAPPPPVLLPLAFLVAPPPADVLLPAARANGPPLALLPCASQPLHVHAAQSPLEPKELLLWPPLLQGL